MCIGYLMFQNTESGEPILLIFIVALANKNHLLCRCE